MIGVIALSTHTFGVQRSSRVVLRKLPARYLFVSATTGSRSVVNPSIRVSCREVIADTDMLLKLNIG